MDGCHKLIIVIDFAQRISVYWPMTYLSKQMSPGEKNVMVRGLYHQSGGPDGLEGGG